MIEGWVSPGGIPEIIVTVAHREWIAEIDTGFNGDLELPEALRNDVNATYFGKVKSHLAANQEIEEPAYDVFFPFDRELCEALATFVKHRTILIGTRLLKAHRLTIDFPSRTLRIERTESGNGQLTTDN
jgi:predicted aspartyl protease